MRSRTVPNGPARPNEIIGEDGLIRGETADLRWCRSQDGAICSVTYKKAVSIDELRKVING